MSAAELPNVTIKQCLVEVKKKQTKPEKEKKRKIQEEPVNDDVRMNV